MSWTNVGPWHAEGYRGNCGNDIPHGRCLWYSVTTGGGYLSFDMVDLDRAEGDRIALSTYSVA